MRAWAARVAREVVSVVGGGLFVLALLGSLALGAFADWLGARIEGGR